MQVPQEELERVRHEIDAYVREAVKRWEKAAEEVRAEEESCARSASYPSAE